MEGSFTGPCEIMGALERVGANLENWLRRERRESSRRQGSITGTLSLVRSFLISVEGGLLGLNWNEIAGFSTASDRESMGVARRYVQDVLLSPESSPAYRKSPAYKKSPWWEDTSSLAQIRRAKRWWHRDPYIDLEARNLKIAGLSIIQDVPYRVLANRFLLCIRHIGRIARGWRAAVVNRLLNSEGGYACYLSRKSDSFPACFTGEAKLLKWIKAQMMPKRKRSGVKLKMERPEVGYFQKKAGNSDILKIAA